MKVLDSLFHNEGQRSSITSTSGVSIKDFATTTHPSNDTWERVLGDKSQNSSSDPASLQTPIHTSNKNSIVGEYGYSNAFNQDEVKLVLQGIIPVEMNNLPLLHYLVSLRVDRKVSFEKITKLVYHPCDDNVWRLPSREEQRKLLEEWTKTMPNRRVLVREEDEDGDRIQSMFCLLAPNIMDVYFPMPTATSAGAARVLRICLLSVATIRLGGPDEERKRLVANDIGSFLAEIMHLPAWNAEFHNIEVEFEQHSGVTFSGLWNVAHLKVVGCNISGPFAEDIGDSIHATSISIWENSHSNATDLIRALQANNTELKLLTIDDTAIKHESQSVLMGQVDKLQYYPDTGATTSKDHRDVPTEEASIHHTGRMDPASTEKDVISDSRPRPQKRRRDSIELTPRKALKTARLT